MLIWQCLDGGILLLLHHHLLHILLLLLLILLLLLLLLLTSSWVHGCGRMGQTSRCFILPDVYFVLASPNKTESPKNMCGSHGPYGDLLATVKRRKLKWYGHVTGSDGLTKLILQGTVEGRRRRGRPKKSWIDNIAEWTGKSFAETQAMAHNRQEWRDLMRKSVMTRPYGSSRS